MFRLAAAILMILLMLAPSMVVAGPKGDVTLTKISDAVPNRIGSVERLVAADTCVVFEGGPVSAGFFEGGSPSIGISSGIVLTTDEFTAGLHCRNRAGSHVAPALLKFPPSGFTCFSYAAMKNLTGLTLRNRCGAIRPRF